MKAATAGVRSRSISLWLGPTLFLIAVLFLPQSILTFNIRVTVGLVIWMAYWWITLPVSPTVTALLPVVINALFNIVPMDCVIKSYAADLVFLLAGANLLSLAWEITGVDKRVALRFMSLVGTSLRQQLVIWLLVSTVLSSILPNTVVTVLLCSIALSMLRSIGEGDVRTSEAAKLILLAIVWGSNVGGMATPLGGAMNLVSVSYIEQLTGIEFMFMDWVLQMAPFTVGITILTLMYIYWVKTTQKNLHGSKQEFAKMVDELPKINRDQILSLALFTVATVLTFTRSLYQGLLPGLKPAYIFLVFGGLTFLFNNKDSGKLMTWKFAEKNIIWGLIIMFAGGTALGSLVNESGAALALAEYIASLNIDNNFLLILIIVTTLVILSDVINNTAAAAVGIPIVIGIAQGMNLPVIPYVLIASIAFNVSYTMPTSNRAIPVGHGLDPKYMFKKGLGLSVIIILFVSCLGFLLVNYMPSFGSF